MPLSLKRISIQTDAFVAFSMYATGFAGNGWHAGAFNTIWNAVSYGKKPVNIPYDRTVRWMDDPVGPLFNFIGLRNAKVRYAKGLVSVGSDSLVPSRSRATLPAAT